jgi:hypothetical protein
MASSNDVDPINMQLRLIHEIKDQCQIDYPFPAKERDPVKLLEHLETFLFLVDADNTHGGKAKTGSSKLIIIIDALNLMEDGNPGQTISKFLYITTSLYNTL